MTIDYRTILPKVAAVSLALMLPYVAVASSPATASKTPKQPNLPSVSTGGARVHDSAVELEGSIDPRGETVTYYFQYGSTVSYGAQTPSANLPVGTTKVKVSQTVTGLQSGYHYRLVATSGSSTRDGHDHTYTIKKVKPVKRLKFTLARPPAEGQVVGSAISISGTLTGPGAAGHGIVLQSSRYPSGGAFTTVGSPQSTDSAGRFSFHVARLQQSTRFRVATLDPQPAYSPVIVELATVHVVFHVHTSPHRGLVRLYGTVSPAVAGARVLFQLQKAAKPKVRAPRSEKAEERAEEKAEKPNFATAFTAPVKHATKTVSRFSSVVSIRKEGRYRAFVEVPTGSLASGYSSAILLHATAQKKSSRKG